MYRISECSGRDRREAHADAGPEVGFFHGIAVAAFQDLRLIDVAALPDRPDRMNHVACLQLRSRRSYGMSRGQSAALLPDLPALPQQIRPSRAVDSAIHSAST